MSIFLTTYRNDTGVNMSSLIYLLQIIWIPLYPYLISSEGGEDDQSITGYDNKSVLGIEIVPNQAILAIA